MKELLFGMLVWLVMGYRAGFYVLAAIVAIMLFSGIFILSSFDKTPSYVLNRVLYVLFSVPADQDVAVFLPSYYYEDLDVLPHTYHRHVKTLDDFHEWKSGPVLEDYRARPTVHQVPHNYTMVFSEERDGYVLSKFTMHTFYPDDIIFYKLTPSITSDQQSARGAVLVIPGSGNQGARDVLGEPSSVSLYYYQGEIARRLVMEGYTVYTIELHGYGERELDAGSACKNRTEYEHLVCSTTQLESRLAMYGISLSAIQTDEITQVLAHIVYDERAGDIAVVGLSLGAWHAASQAIINSDVVDAVAIASGVISHANSPISEETIGRGQFLCCDTNDGVATIAPKPMYVSFGKNEIGSLWLEANTNHTGNFLRDVYRLHDAEKNLYYYVHDGEHEYHVDTVIDFLGTHIG